MGHGSLICPKRLLNYKGCTFLNVLYLVVMLESKQIIQYKAERKCTLLLCTLWKLEQQSILMHCTAIISAGVRKSQAFNSANATATEHPQMHSKWIMTLNCFFPPSEKKWGSRSELIDFSVCERHPRNKSPLATFDSVHWHSRADSFSRRLKMT